MESKLTSTTNENKIELEEQRYGRNKGLTINHAYINSGEYRSKFDNITDNDTVNRVIYSLAKEMLWHRSGTMIEDMYWIDKDTGTVVASVTNQTDEIVKQIKYPKAVKNAIKGKHNLIAMHTHPESMPPSVADFNSAYAHEYNIALVICHDGKIIRYISKEEIREALYNLYLGEYLDRGYLEFEAQWKTLEKLKENHDIDFGEVKP